MSIHEKFISHLYWYRCIIYNAMRTFFEGGCGFYWYYPGRERWTASGGTFKKFLKENGHPHPLVYLGNVLPLTPICAYKCRTCGSLTLPSIVCWTPTWPAWGQPGCYPPPTCARCEDTFEAQDLIVVHMMYHVVKSYIASVGMSFIRSQCSGIQDLRGDGVLPCTASCHQGIIKPCWQQTLPMLKLEPLAKSTHWPNHHLPVSLETLITV